MTLSSPDGDSSNKSKKKTDKNCTLVVSLIQKGTRQRKAITDGNGCLVIGTSLLHSAMKFQAYRKSNR